MEKKIQNFKSAFAVKNRRKNLALTIVALLLVVMTMVVYTFSWIENTSSVHIYTEPLDEGKHNIDTRTYAIANVGTKTDASARINLDKYFKDSGNVHLAPALSPDGVDFYFRKLKDTDTPSYRKGNLNDKNTNYISFSFKIKAVDSYTAFYFGSIPQIKIGDTVITENDVRFAITAGSNTAVYSNKQNNSEKIKINGKEYTSVIRSFKNYANETATDFLFALEKDATEVVTITMWLNDTANADFAGKAVTVSDFKLITSAQKTTQIKFVDKTTGFNGETSANSGKDNDGYGWLTNNDANMWIKYGTTEAVMNKTTDKDGFTVWTYNANEIESATDIYFYRCAPDVTEISKAGNKLWNTWKTSWADAKAKSSLSYTAYSATDSNNMGYGTWGKVVEYTLNSEYTSVLPIPAANQTYNATQVTLTVGDKTSQMNYFESKWRAFVPDEGIKTVKFTFKHNNVSYTITPATKPADTYDYTLTYATASANTGYWGTPVVITLGYADGSQSNMGNVSVSGGKPGVQQVKVTKGTKVTFDAKDSTDYYFVSWHSEKTATDSNRIDKEVTANEDKTYYAKYAKFIEISVDYVNGYSGPTNSISVTGGSTSVKVKMNEKVELNYTDVNGYSFEGWYDNENGTGNKITSPVTAKADKTYFAKYVPSYTISVALASSSSNMGTVSVSGGTESGASISVAPNTAISFTATPKDGYVFVEWQDASGNKISTMPTTATESKTYYAKFKRVVYLNYSKWDAANDVERYACYVWKSTNDKDHYWIDMTYDSATGLYVADYPASGYDRIIFVRMDGGTTANNWDNDWNQTGNLTLDGTNNYCTITGWDKSQTWTAYSST